MTRRSRTSAAVVAALVLAGLVASGCSSDDDRSPASPRSTTKKSAATTSTTPPTVAPITTTTAVPGERVDDATAYESAGLTPAQADCVKKSGYDGDFQATPGPTLSDAIVLTADSGKMVAVPATLRTGAELQQLMLVTFASTCAPADRLAALATSEGAEIDAGALDDLTAYLANRTKDGASATELACLDKGFREAPIRLSSLAARPVAIESACASETRRQAWRAKALDRGLRTAGLTDKERACVTASTQEQLLLASAVDAMGSGQPGTDPFRDAHPTCFTTDRLQKAALEIIASGADFGAEDLTPTFLLPTVTVPQTTAPSK